MTVKVPGKTFKLSKSTKRLLAGINDSHARGAFKRDMIQAELFAAFVPKRERKGEQADAK